MSDRITSIWLKTMTKHKHFLSSLKKVFETKPPYLLWYTVSALMRKLCLVRVFSQTRICLMEHHVPVVFTNCSNSAPRPAAQEDEMSGWIKPCTFPWGNWTNQKGLSTFLSSHVFSRETVFFSSSPSAWPVKGMQRRTKDVPDWECYCFQSFKWHASHQTADLPSVRPRLCLNACYSTCKGLATFLSTLYFWIRTINQQQIEVITSQEK